MIRTVFAITLTITTSLCASEKMDIPLNKAIRYEKTHSSPKPNKQKSFTKKMQHKRRLLREKLEEKPECFWMWTPEEGAFHSLYEAKNKKDIITIINYCNPSLRMDEYSILSSIMLSPNISFQEKKEIIAPLLQNYTPTDADKRINHLETLERCEKKGIAQPVSELIFNTESLL